MKLLKSADLRDRRLKDTPTLEGIETRFARRRGCSCPRSERHTNPGGDGYGQRYLLGPLSLLMGDTQGALKSFTWFEQTFPDDSDDPLRV
jgi:hypothetical protein